MLCRMPGCTRPRDGRRSVCRQCHNKARKQSYHGKQALSRFCSKEPRLHARHCWGCLSSGARYTDQNPDYYANGAKAILCDDCNTDFQDGRKHCPGVFGHPERWECFWKPLEEFSKDRRRCKICDSARHTYKPSELQKRMIEEVRAAKLSAVQKAIHRLADVIGSYRLQECSACERRGYHCNTNHTGTCDDCAKKWQKGQKKCKACKRFRHASQYDSRNPNKCRACVQFRIHTRIKPEELIKMTTEQAIEQIKAGLTTELQYRLDDLAEAFTEDAILQIWNILQQYEKPRDFDRLEGFAEAFKQDQGFLELHGLTPATDQECEPVFLPSLLPLMEAEAKQ